MSDTGHAVAYAYVVDGSIEEIGWGVPTLKNDPSLVLLYDAPRVSGAALGVVRKALVEKAEAHGLLSVEDIDEVFAAFPVALIKSNSIEAALRYARVSILSGTGTVTAVARIDEALEDLSAIEPSPSLPILVEALERIKRDARDKSEKAWFRCEMIADEATAALASIKGGQ